MSDCGAVASIMGMTFACEKPSGHDGNHGNGPFVQYTTEWPRLVLPELELETRMRGKVKP